MNQRRPRTDTFLYELERDSQVSTLITYLRFGETSLVRRRAAEILGDLTDSQNQYDQTQIENALIRRVKQDEDESVRASAITALYKLGDDSFARLVERVSDEKSELSPGGLSGQTITQWFETEYPEFRIVAAAALGLTEDRSALPALLAVFDDPDARVRAQAVAAVGRIGGSSCVAALKERLDDSDHRVRQEAAIALGNIGTEQALEALIPIAFSDSESLRRIAVDEIGQFRSAKPVFALVQALEDTSEMVQRTAVLSFVNILATLSANKSKTIRRNFEKQLQEVGASETLPTLVELVNESERQSQRRNATWLLGRIATGEHDDVYDCLIAALDDSDRVTAQLAATSLVEIGGSEVDKRLRKFIQNERGSPEAHDRAELVLQEIGTPLSREVITDSIDFTYVNKPSDYTAKKRDD